MADKVIDMFDDFQKRMAEIPSLVQQTALNIQDTAKRDAPIDEGRLRNSITATGSGAEAEVSTDVEYARHQEFGTYKMAAQPFLMPAFEYHSERLVRAIKKILQ